MAGGAGGADRTGAGVGDAGGSLPEVVGDAAILVDPSDVAQIADAMSLALTQPALAAQLRARGLARAAQFTWERTAEDGGRTTADGGRRSAAGRLTGWREVGIMTLSNRNLAAFEPWQVVRR